MRTLALFQKSSLSLWRRGRQLPYRIFSSGLCTDITTTTPNIDEVQSSRVKIFDRHLKQKQRDRAAWLMHPKDCFVDAVVENLLDRLEDCKKAFPRALCSGGSLEAIRRLLRGRGAIENLIMMDTSYDMVKLCKDAEKDMENGNIEASYLVGDEEFLPVKESSLDLVISCLGLHWTNDLPGAMIQSRLALKPDGLFLAAILGGETLKLELRIACTVAQMEREGGISPRVSPLAQSRLALKPDGLFLAAILGGETLKLELRIACTVAQMEREGGISPRVSPLAQVSFICTSFSYLRFDVLDSLIYVTPIITTQKVRDAGNLLTRAGFSLPGVDVEEYVVKYPSALELIEHLRAMGETNALLQRSPILERETALATAAIYDSMFAAEDGTIPATFQVIYMTGWRDHPSQQKARSRGSATISFKDIQQQLGRES
ncbi:putative methyltransferase At1g22800 [Morella rubra]|uniref:Putative methyltransferase At1g22800 n=1 Tax=Morella rubra TaxID=262757 RepID=A0A6A1VDV5_9ROSI|nr:putative methyltransferase At1g22800 [Morella rubra]